MYEIFVYDHKSSYCFYDDVIDANKHLYIELGSRIFIPDLDITYLVLAPGKWIPLGGKSKPEEEPDEPETSIISTLGEGILGNIILGE